MLALSNTPKQYKATHLIKAASCVQSVGVHCALLHCVGLCASKLCIVELPRFVCKQIVQTMKRCVCANCANNERVNHISATKMHAPYKLSALHLVGAFGDQEYTTDNKSDPYFCSYYVFHCIRWLEVTRYKYKHKYI